MSRAIHNADFIALRDQISGIIANAVFDGQNLLSGPTGTNITFLASTNGSTSLNLPIVDLRLPAAPGAIASPAAAMYLGSGTALTTAADGVDAAARVSASLDFVNTEQVFEHVPAPRELAKRLAASLKPGGILKICVPYGEDIERRIELGEWQAERGSRHSLDPVAPLEHINCFKFETLRRLAADLGLGFERPQVLPQFAYLAHSGTWSLAVPSNLLKELSRPLQRRFSRRGFRHKERGELVHHLH
jgi:SAM-dependent methyltransferase